MLKYEIDYAGWAEEQAGLLRAKLFDQIDLENLVHEVENIMGNERREISHRLVVLTAHLLKWQFQPEMRSNSWRSTIRIQRRDISKVLRDSPSLKRFFIDLLDEAYPEGRELASYETGLIEKDLPIECPWDEHEVMNQDFWPD